MARTSLFSTYKGGENRVTASMLGVFSRLDVTRLERILGAAVGDSSFQMVSFQNQPTTDASSTVPDGRISGQFSLWIETKIQPGQLGRRQLEGHLGHLKAPPDTFERLIAITPDGDEPAAIGELNDPRAVWVSFVGLRDAIEAELRDPSDVVSEREQVLLRELLQLFEDEGLLALQQDTVIVAAGSAYDDYVKYSAYVCQPGRSFRPRLKHLGFYRRKRIEATVPAILYSKDNVEVSPESIAELAAGSDLDQRVAALVERLLSDGARPVGGVYKIILLSEPGDERTLHLREPIAHRFPRAWTQGQRYASSEELEVALSTTDLGGG